VKTWEWYFEPFLIPLGQWLWRIQIRNEDRAWNWSNDHPESTDDELFQRIFWGVPRIVCQNFYEESREYAERLYIERDHSSRKIVRYYEGKYLLREILKYYLRKKQPFTP